MPIAPEGFVEDSNNNDEFEFFHKGNIEELRVKFVVTNKIFMNSACSGRVFPTGVGMKTVQNAIG
ncbi:MAG: hypothetical protein SRB2_01901 [Desulfobacteraceae bacterium Eth-SRB2]|nr:MAG: hypothetical protein SRB2_01901 [Desulfobacteraceae bacterium Eth-SRB2]